MKDNDEDTCPEEKNIKIFVRIFPFEKVCESCAKLDMEHKKIYIRCLQDLQPNRISSPKKPSFWCFQVDGIFFNSSQEEIYRDSAEDLVSKVLAGVSCVLMGYGQTGSGKTFTVGGLRNNWEHRGLVARLLSNMFVERMRRKPANKIEYRVSFVELYGKEVKDLLAPETENRVKINERDPFKNISVIYVDNEEDGLKKIFEGEFRRSIAKGSTYPASHLATAVITFHVSNTSLSTSCGVVTTGKMHIVEAAGTGTVGRNVDWKTAADIGMANLMRTQLEQFFAYIAGPGSCINTVRSSNLLKILGNAFSVSSIIRFICHIRISKEDLDITLSTLRFTSKIARLKPVRLKEDIKYQSNLMIHKLQDEVVALRKELTINDMFLRQEVFTNISKSRMEQIYRSLLNFLNGTISDFTLFSVCQAQILLKCIKDLYIRLTAKEHEVDQLMETYENLLKNMSRGTEGSIDDRTSVRKRTRSTSQMITEIEEVKETPEKEEVGSLNRNSGGVTLGPYTEEEGEKASESSRQVAVSEQTSKTDDQNTRMIRQLFECFLKEDKEYANIKEKFDNNETTLINIREKFLNTLDSYFQARRNLNEAHDMLCKQQQIRFVLELGTQKTNDGLIEIEQSIERDILCHQKVLVNLQEEVQQLQDELTMLSDQCIDMSSKLKSGFREYCRNKNLLLHHIEKSMKVLLEPIKVESLDAIRCKFNKLQQMFLRKSEGPKHARNKRQEYKRKCHCTN